MSPSPSSMTGFIAYAANPSAIGSTISRALSHVERRGSQLQFTPWEALDIPGRFIADEIASAIEHAQFLVADISTPNFNVTYEIGFAIGLNRRVLLIKDRSISLPTEFTRQLGIFDTIGYREYDNSTELAKFLTAISDVRPLKTAVELNRLQPVYLLHTKAKRDHPLHVVSCLKSVGLTYRTYDPDEQTRLIVSEAIEQVSESYGVIVQLVPSFIEDHAIHNLRGAFIAGLANGLGKNLAILQEGNDPVPVDYRDLVYPCTHLEDVSRAVSVFARHVVESLTAGDKARVRLPDNLLSQLDLGASSAENEYRTLHEYYHETDAYRRARRGEARIVVGRKGSGKTAIFFQLRDELRRDPNALILDLKPEGYKLLKFKESVLNNLEGGAFEHTIIAFWNFVLLHQLCYHVLDADKDRHVRNHHLFDDYRLLADIYYRDFGSYDGDFSERISRLIDRIALDYKAKYGEATNVGLAAPEVTELVYRKDIRPLEDALFSYLRHKNRVWVLFDNLDKGWPSHGLQERDAAIIRSLLEAGRKIEHSCQRQKIEAHTIVFLRNDVYELLVQETPDRGKESRLLIDWDDPEQLRAMLRLRIQRSLPSSVDFQAAWRSICTPFYDGQESSKYLIERTLMRPRFFLDLVKACKGYAINLNHAHIEEDDIRKGLHAFSASLIQEIHYEMQDVAQVQSDTLYAFVDAPKRLSFDDILDRLLQWRIDASTVPDIIDNLLWYGFLGLVQPNGDAVYIHNLNYDWAGLKGRHKLFVKTHIAYEINPAFWAGLDISV